MMIYQDNLISVTEDEIIFKHYYFLTGKSKTVPLSDIEWIQVKPPTIGNGKWTNHRSGRSVHAT